MELYTSKFIQGILNQIPKQNNHEKYITILPFTNYHNIILNSDIIQFDENCIFSYPTPLTNIFGTIVIDNVLYILFNNLCLHVLYQSGKHTVLFLESNFVEVQ